MKILQIAILVNSIEPLKIGLERFPVGKLVVLHRGAKRGLINDMRRVCHREDIEMETRLIGENVFEDIHRVLHNIVTDPGNEGFGDIYMNVGEGSGFLACAALSCSFINGIKAFNITNGDPITLPVLKFNFRDMVSESKMEILRTLRNLGGSVDSLNTLGQVIEIEKSLLSYHIRGGRDSRGLEDMGLVETKKEKKGRLRITLTLLGELLLISEDESERSSGRK